MNRFISVAILLMLVSVSFAALPPRLVVNNELKQCRIFEDAGSDYNLVHGWKVAFRSDDSGSYVKAYPLNESMLYCSSLGYTFSQESPPLAEINMSFYETAVLLAIIVIIYFFVTRKTKK
jgi:hypothetical protein